MHLYAQQVQFNSYFQRKDPLKEDKTKYLDKSGNLPTFGVLYT